MGATEVALTRRAAMLAAGAVLTAAAFPARAQTATAPSTRFGGVRVDTGPLAAIGGGASAPLIQRILPGKLATVFADLIVIDRTAPVLVARIDRLWLSAFGDTTPPGLALQSQDWMDGAGLVVAGRQVQASTPLHVTLPASYSGAYYLPDIDERRIDSLCYQFAYWLRREMQV